MFFKYFMSRMDNVLKFAFEITYIAHVLVKQTYILNFETFCVEIRYGISIVFPFKHFAFGFSKTISERVAH